MKLGTCYYPEHWPENLWAEDALRMVETGLYLVRKVAEAHGGSVSYLVHDNATVTFDLFLPD